MPGPAVFDNPYRESRDVHGVAVTILQGKTDDRGLQLESAYRSRTVVAGSIHELMLTDEEAEPGRQVDRVGLIAFFEVVRPGVLLVGAEVEIAGKPVGRIAGFDDTHMPNHQNICLVAGELIDARDLDIHVDDEIVIRQGHLGLAR